MKSFLMAFMALAMSACGQCDRPITTDARADMAQGQCMCGYTCCAVVCDAGECPLSVIEPHPMYHPEVSGVYPVPLLPTTPDQGEPDSARTPVRPRPIPPPPQDPPHKNGQAHCPSGVC